jgi:hypothetical protein
MEVSAEYLPHEHLSAVAFSYNNQAFRCNPVIVNIITMSLGADLQRKLSRKYEPSSMIHLTFRGNDLAVQTDSDGNPVVLFIGKMSIDGKIRGQRYARTLKADPSGRVIKDHWDLKGKV